MNSAKGSKNAIENRGAKSVMICKTCGEERKPLKLMGGGKAKMAFECKCGMSDKIGNPV